MGMIFGKKKPVSRVTDQDKAVLVSNTKINFFLFMFTCYFVFQQLKQQRDKLKQYQKKIERRLEADRELARKLITNGQKE